MSASERRKQRRAARRAAKEKIETIPDARAVPILRLVRPEDESIPVEQISAGCSGTALIGVLETGRPDSGGGSETRQPDVVAAADARTDERPPHGLVRRSFDVAEINPVMNDPDVFKYIAAPGLDAFDLAPLLADQNNVLLMADGGGIFCLWHEPGLYEVHTCFRKAPKGTHGDHGSYVGNVCRDAYRWMFTHTDCTALLTKIPAHNRAATVFAPLGGWVKEFERKDAWLTLDGDLVDMSYHAIRYDDWVRKTPDLKHVGREFHEHLQREFLRHGKIEDQHPDEDCHDLHVGACIEMIIGGQLDKAVFFYNRWARFAGYGTISLCSRAPVVFDIGNAMLQVKDGAFKVIMVR